MRTKRAGSITLPLLCGLLTACGALGGPSEPTPDLDGTDWALIRMDGREPLRGSHVSLRFGEDQLGGVAGCNAYGGVYEANPRGSLAVGDIFSTEMACLQPEGVLDQEAAYLRLLGNAAAYRVQDDHLIIDSEGEEGALVFTARPASSGDPAALVGTAWRLASLNGETARQDYTMAFPSRGLALGRAVCRAYLARYVTEDRRLSFVATSMAGTFCPELAEEESAFTDALTWAGRFDIAPDRFELRTDRGETLVFEPLDAAPALAGTSWSLVAFVEPLTVEGEAEAVLLPDEPIAGSTITLGFSDDALDGNAGCNRYSGAYGRDGRRLDIGEVSLTEMACLEPAGVMAQELRYVGVLVDVTSFIVAGDILWLDGGDRSSLIFELAGPR